jgi:hypothetical protein
MDCATAAAVITGLFAGPTPASASPPCVAQAVHLKTAIRRSRFVQADSSWFAGRSRWSRSPLSMATMLRRFGPRLCVRFGAHPARGP